MSKSPAVESLRQKNKREKLERLTRAARELFSEQGFQDTTIRQIAARAGIGVGTVFLYVKDKEGLLQLLFAEAVLGIQDNAFATLPAPSKTVGLVDQILHIFERFYRYYGKDRTLSRLFIKELMFVQEERSQDRRQLTFQFLGRLAEQVQKAQAQGELSGDAPPLLVAANFFASYFMVLLAFLDASQDISMDVNQAVATLRAALELQVAGLRPAANPSTPKGPEQAPPKRQRSQPRGSSGGAK